MNKFLNRLLPHRNIKNISMFYILSGVYNAWIIAGVWVFIWGAFMTKTQIGISDSITFAVGFLVELPSGVFADLIGRKKAILMGNILLFIGNLFIAFSSSFLGITVWYLVWTIGYAFQSGSTEAHAYDSLKKEGFENDWHRVISASTIIGRIAILIATAMGGYLFLLGFRLPYLVMAVISLIGVFAAMNLTEIVVKTKPELWSFKTYLNQIKEGIGVLIKPNIFPISLISLVTLGVAHMYNWGLLRPLTAERFGFSPTTYSLLMSLTATILIFCIFLLKFIQRKIKTEKLLLITGVSYSVLFTVLGFPHKLLIGGIIMILLSIGLSYTDILFSQFINKHTSERHRATTLSAIALFTKLPYVLLAFIIGNIAERNGLPQYTIIVGVIAVFLWLVSFTMFSIRNKGYDN